jgi:hypothetical protein
MNFLLTSRIRPLVLAMLLTACGSSKTSSDDPVALCKEGCTKGLSLCYADAGVEGATFKSLCEAQCSSTKVTQANMCSNASQITSGFKACLAKTTCDEYESCFAALPDCAGSGGGGSTGAGTGGSTGGGTGGATGTGTGGSTAGGTGGATGTATGGSTGAGTGGSTGGGTACADLLTCCNASTIPLIKSMCATVATGLTDDAACAQALTAYKMTVCP